jgi:D-alanyl-D-alanine carboxypeptidase
MPSLYLYPGADGLKTGFTCGSGYNLVASALRDGKRVIGVLLGGLTSDQRFGGMRVLLDKGFAAEGARAAAPLTIGQMKDADRRRRRSSSPPRPAPPAGRCSPTAGCGPPAGLGHRLRRLPAGRRPRTTCSSAA